MTRVDFYVFESGNEDSFARFICRLTEKAWRKGNRIFMHCPDRHVATRFDDLLWTRGAESAAAGLLAKPWN